MKLPSFGRPRFFDRDLFLEDGLGPRFSGDLAAGHVISIPFLGVQVLWVSMPSGRVS